MLVIFFITFKILNEKFIQHSYYRKVQITNKKKYFNWIIKYI